MLFYRTKREANNKPMYRGKGKRKDEEIWSIYIADELFTEAEVKRLNLNLAYLEQVEISRRQTHHQGCYRVANFDANITAVKPVKQAPVKILPKQAEIEVVKRLNDRRVYKKHKCLCPDNRSTTKFVRYRVANDAAVANK